MYAHNSSIKVKSKACCICGRVGPIFSKGRCQTCARIQDVQARIAKESERDIEAQEGLPELIEEADAIFSRYIRMKASNKDGYLNCYICGKLIRWQDAQNMHYIPRGNSLLRFDETRNCRAGCKDCNEYKNGNLIAYGKKLELEFHGITEIILEESRIPYKLGRDEVRQIISEYTNKIKTIKQ